MSRQMDDLIRQGELGWSPGADTFVCATCPGDAALAEVVNANLVETRCSYCDREDDEPIAAPLDALTEHIAVCLNDEYTDPANELSWDSEDGVYVGEVWDAHELLERVEFEPDSRHLFNDVASSLSDRQWCEIDSFALSPADRRQYGWEHFKRAVKHERRFTFWSMRDDSVDEHHPDHLPVGNMLAEIAGTVRSAGLIRLIPVGMRYWRVRVHDPGQTLSADHELSPPPCERAIQSNRMSPAGIPMFYGAEEFETSCVETIDARGDRNRRVTGVVFATTRAMSILDLARMPHVPSYFDRQKAALRHTLRFLHRFSHDVARPLDRDGTEHIEYVPTQAFTEYVRFEMAGIDGAPVDGIRYRSSKGGEACVVLFCGQDNCVANPKGHMVDRWLQMDAATLQSMTVADWIRSRCRRRRNGRLPRGVP